GARRDFYVPFRGPAAAAGSGVQKTGGARAGEPAGHRLEIRAGDRAGAGGVPLRGRTGPRLALQPFEQTIHLLLQLAVWLDLQRTLGGLRRPQRIVRVTPLVQPLDKGPDNPIKKLDSCSMAGAVQQTVIGAQLRIDWILRHAAVHGFDVVINVDVRTRRFDLLGKLLFLKIG